MLLFHPHWRRRVRTAGSWAVVLLAMVALGPAPTRAGGPLFMRADGQPYRWDPAAPFRYAVSPGPFGSRSHAWAVDAAARAYQMWQSVPMVHLPPIAAAGELTIAVTGDSLMSFLDGLKPDDPSPILFDNDGSLIDQLFGRGASAAALGIGSPYSADTSSGRIRVSFAVLNGPLFARFSDRFVLGSIVHELGHTLNMAHSQVNADELFDGEPDNDGLAAAMFYRGPNNPGVLSRDDQAWISWLYPSLDFAGATGTIRGRVLLPDGVTGCRGIHVIARQVGDPRVTAVGAVSGYLFQSSALFGLGGGTSDPARMGEFVIPGLPPGSYTLEVDSLAAFPAVSVPPGYLVGGKKLWHVGSSGQDDPTASSLIEVKAGREVAGIDLLLNGDRLGEPQAVAEKTPNLWPNPQPVPLPAEITGTIEDPAAGAPGHDYRSEADLQRVYQVTLADPTVVTALLSAADPAVDLDLFVLGEFQGRRFLEGAARQNGTPPEVAQLRLPAGRHYFGVHVAGARGGAYTLRLLATPAPDPDSAPQPVAVNYLLIGDVTPTGATVHWQTTDDSPSVLYYNLPLREIGSTKQERDHTLILPDLAPGSSTEVQVYASSAAGPDELLAPLTTAIAPAAGGSPRLVPSSSHQPLIFGIELVTVQLANRANGDALKVKADQLTPAPGWVFVVPILFGTRLPSALDFGTIGAGGAGSFAALLFRASGSAPAKITLHGAYTDAAGNPQTF